MLIYMCVYIYQAKFLIEKYSFMDEKEKEPFRGWSQPRCVQWARHVVLPAAKAAGPSPCLTSAALGGPGGSATLWVPSNKGLGERGDIDRTGALRPILLWPHVLGCGLMWFHISKKHHEDGKRDLPQCLARGCLWHRGARDGRHTPQNKTLEKETGRAHPPGQSSH